MDVRVMRTFKYVNILNDPRTDLTGSSHTEQTWAEKYQKTRASDVTSLEVKIKTKGKYHFPMGVRNSPCLIQSGQLGVEVVDNTAHN